MTHIQSIPLNLLSLSPNNPRKTGGDDITDLVASIEAEGLLNNLLVTPYQDGEVFLVEDGGRRLRALQRLNGDGRLPAALDDGIPCRVMDADNGAEAGLHANIIRMAMHPADEFTAFQNLVEQRRSVTEIAERFGKSEQHVRQRLQLAKVRPEYVQLYRAGEMSLAQLEALASTTNHELQRQAWETARDWERDPKTLRRFMSRDAIAGDSALAQFVGIEAYEAAGGKLRRDLFTNEVWLLDPSIVEKLASDALHAKAEELKAAGWSFADVMLPNGEANTYDYGWHPQSHTGKKVFATAEDQARDAALEKREEEIRDIDSDDVDEATESALEDELEAIEEERSAINDRSSIAIAPEIMAKSGVIVRLDRDGNLDIEYARLQPGQKAGKAAAPAGNGAKAKPRKVEYSAAVLQQLSAHRSLAAQVAIRHNTALANSLLIDRLLDGWNGVRARTEAARTARDIAKDAHKANSEAVKGFRKYLDTSIPKKDRLAFLLKQTDGWRAETLAIITAIHFDGITDHANGHTTVAAIDAVSPLGMAEAWSPACEDFLARIHADLRVQAVVEACGKEAAAKLAGLKKAEHVAATAKLLANSGWLPKPLRSPGYSLKKAGTAKKPAAPAKNPTKKKSAAKKAPKKKAAAK